MTKCECGSLKTGGNHSSWCPVMTNSNQPVKERKGYQGNGNQPVIGQNKTLEEYSRIASDIKERRAAAKEAATRASEVYGKTHEELSKIEREYNDFVNDSWRAWCNFLDK